MIMKKYSLQWIIYAVNVVELISQFSVAFAI